MGGAGTRLKLFKNVVVFEMVLMVPGSYFLQNLRKKWQVGYGPLISNGRFLELWSKYCHF